jgi:hypothetical protein
VAERELEGKTKATVDGTINGFDDILVTDMQQLLAADTSNPEGQTAITDCTMDTIGDILAADTQ